MAVVRTISKLRCPPLTLFYLFFCHFHNFLPSFCFLLTFSMFWTKLLYVWASKNMFSLSKYWRYVFYHKMRGEGLTGFANLPLKVKQLIFRGKRQNNPAAEAKLIKCISSNECLLGKLAKNAFGCWRRWNNWFVQPEDQTNNRGENILHASSDEDISALSSSIFLP